MMKTLLSGTWVLGLQSTKFTGSALALLALAGTGTQTLAQSSYTPYTFTNFAGMPGVSGAADGTGSAARFYGPLGVAVDSATNVYVADTDNNTIRKVTPGGAVTTLAGLAGTPGSADGTGSAALFNNPYGVPVDSAGNVYVADFYNSTIREVTQAGVVTTLAGLAGTKGSADGTGSVALFDGPTGVAVDTATNVYVADFFNSSIRKVTPAGVVTTLAGLAGSPGSADGTGSAARFDGPTGVAVDSAGNVYVGDRYNSTVRKVTPAGVVTTLAGLAGSPGSADGTGSAALFNAPCGVAVDSAGNVYVADCYNNTIRKVTPGGVVRTLAGLTGTAGSADGTGSAAQFDFPYGVAVDSAGNVYVADRYNDRVTKGTPPPSIASGATATASVVDGFVVSATITDGGYGYTNTPTVRIIGGGGSGAEAVAVVTNGAVTAVNVLDAGSGYTNTPVVVIAPPFIPQPTMGIAAMSLLSFTGLAVGTNYQLQSFVGGTLFNVGAAFNASGSTFTQLVVGTAGLNGYRLAVTPVPEQAYASAQVVDGFVVAATVTSGGSGYTASPVVSILNDAGGSNATAIATVSGGAVTGITISSAGIGYTNTPSIIIAPPPANALLPMVSQVMELSFGSLSPYDNYQLEFVPVIDGTWSNFGIPFTPTSPISTQYVSASGNAGFFRVKYVP